MFNFSQLTHESHDTAQELIDWFDVEGLSLGYRNGEWVVTDSKLGTTYFTAEFAWEVRDYINDIDHECECDGAEPVYLCSFPPCVAQRAAEDAYWAEQYKTMYPTGNPYDRTDPKHPDYAQSIIDRIDEGRI